MWTLDFWKQTAERAVKTAAQSALAFFVIGQTVLSDLDWTVVGGAAAVACIASVLTSLVSAPFGQEHSPSLVEVKNG